MPFRQYEPLRTRPAKRALPKISRAGAKVLEHVAKRTKFVDPELTGNWPTLAGADIAALCRPGRITGPPSNRTLEVYARSGAAASQLQMKLDPLLEKLRSYFGPGGISRIIIRQTAQPITIARADGDKDERLGAALSAFRNAVKQRSKPPKNTEK